MKDNQNYVVKLETPELTWEDVGKTLALTAGMMAVTGLVFGHFADGLNFSNKFDMAEKSIGELEVAIKGDIWKRISSTDKLLLLTEYNVRKIQEEKEEAA